MGGLGGIIMSENVRRACAIDRLSFDCRFSFWITLAVSVVVIAGGLFLLGRDLLDWWRSRRNSSQRRS